jgi:ubiquinone/menaquinone biosynthesis C-methylase UbiE
MPNIHSDDMAVLDIGCGFGQTFIALKCTDRLCVGLDIDESAIRYGISNYGDQIQFINADASRIPMPSNLFDLVYSRVSLPCMNIPVVIKEIRRVLKTGGRVWMTLHSRRLSERILRESWKARQLKNIAYGIYALLNGYIFKYLGILLPYFNGSYESWQHIPTMIKILEKNDFEITEIKENDHTMVEAKARENSADKR